MSYTKEQKAALEQAFKAHWARDEVYLQWGKDDQTLTVIRRQPDPQLGMDVLGHWYGSNLEQMAKVGRVTLSSFSANSAVATMLFFFDIREGLPTLGGAACNTP